MVLGCLSVLIVWAETTIWTTTDLSPLSLLIKDTRNSEFVVQVITLLPLVRKRPLASTPARDTRMCYMAASSASLTGTLLEHLACSCHTSSVFKLSFLHPSPPCQAYICACTYAAMFSITAFDYNKLIPRATIGSALMQNGMLMCRFAAPTCWNFYHMVRMTTKDSGGEQRHRTSLPGRALLACMPAGACRIHMPGDRKSVCSLPATCA